MIGPPVKTFLVEIGDPHVDEAWCVCGAKKKSPHRSDLVVWAWRHNANHLDPLGAIDIRRDQDGEALIGKYGDTADDLRSKLSGWHFSKESLTQGERDILYVAEQLMSELDRLAGDFFQ